MTRKNLLKIVLSSLIAISPSLGTEESPLFDDTDVKESSLMRVFEKEKDEWRAKIKVINNSGKVAIHITPVSTIETIGWKNNDEALFSQKKIKATVDCMSGEELEFDTVLATQYPYTQLPDKSEINLLNGAEIIDAGLPLGKVVNVHDQVKYTRGDQPPTTYTKTSDVIYQAVARAFYNGQEFRENNLFNMPLNTPVSVYKVRVGEEISPGNNMPIYSLIAKETRTSKGQIYRCYEHKNEWQQKGLKGYNQLRHWHETYNATELTLQVFKLSLGGQEIPLPGFTKTELLLKLINRDSGRTNKPECAPNGQSFPPNSRVI